MKKRLTSILVCALALSCTKSIEETSTLPCGEELTFSPVETKVAIGGDSGDGSRKYVFEADDEIIAVSSNGSKAILTLVDGCTDKFKGTFDNPAGEGSTISLYYNCWSYDDNKAVWQQNGKPWLLSKDNAFTRDENEKIVISATLDAPEGVVGMPLISAFGACTVDFSAKTADIASFDGTSFSGGKTISGLSLESRSEADADEYTAVVNLPAGMEGGFWLKVTKDSETMYRSSAATVSDRSFKMDSFTAAAVNLNVTVSGFPTTYSYAAGTDGVSKNISTANSKSNSWMGSGTATYTISGEGIPAALLTFQSFTISGEGISASGDETTKTISVGETSSHTSWGAKTITATVTYKDIAGNTYTKSASVTRHITGLPYSVNPPKNSGDHSWSKNGSCSFENSYVKFGGGGGSGSCSMNFFCPLDIDINLSAKIDAYGAPINTTTYIDISGTREFSCTSNSSAFKYKTVTAEKTASTSLKSNNPNITAGTTYGLGATCGKLYYVNITYR